jgi:hypothetical protein
MRQRIAKWVFVQLVFRVVCQRQPDFIVGADNPDGAYLNRWFLTPWRRMQTRLRKRAESAPTWWNQATARVAGLLPNLYLHHFLRDDDDRALHDHPSFAVSFIISGGYIEHTIDAGGIHRRRLFGPGTLRFLSTLHTHRIELPQRRDDGPTMTLFLFGPAVREWGFHCPERGWVHWKLFTAEGMPGEIGGGCDA